VARGLTAALLGFPLVWEATVRFATLTPPFAFAASTAIASGILWLAARHGLPVLAWAASVMGVATQLSLLASTHAAQPALLALLALGLATWWLARRCDWAGVAWLPALALDLAVFELTALFAREGGPPGDYAGLDPTSCALLAAALPIIYIGTLAAAIAARGDGPSVFEWVQSALALVVGVVSVRAAATPAADPALAAVMIAAGVSGHAIAWIRRPAQGAAYLTWTGLALVASGAALALSGSSLAVIYCVLALALAGSARAGDLSLHAVVAVVASALASGLARTAVEAALAPRVAPAPAAAWLAVVTALACHGIVARAATERRARLAAGVLGCLWLAGAYGLLVATVATRASPAVLALVRCVVLAAAAVGVAASRPIPLLRDVRWLAYPLLVASGLDLLLENLGHGRPLTLFVAFAAYGVALRLTARSAEKI
jgi:hypothetical protein